jgi:hypothetical protein
MIEQLLNEENNNADHSSSAEKKTGAGLHHGIRLAPTDIAFLATDEYLLQNMKWTQKHQESIIDDPPSNTSVQK